MKINILYQTNNFFIPNISKINFNFGCSKANACGYTLQRKMGVRSLYFSNRGFLFSKQQEYNLARNINFYLCIILLLLMFRFSMQPLGTSLSVMCRCDCYLPIQVHNVLPGTFHLSKYITANFAVMYLSERYVPVRTLCT